MEDTQMVVVLGRIDVHRDDVAAVIVLAASMAHETRKEPGCLHYAFGQDVTETNRLWLSEQWQDANALTEHFKTPHMVAFRAGLRALRVAHLSASSYEAAVIADLISR
jgi:quinol monooxygenase YgiN